MKKLFPLVSALMIASVGVAAEEAPEFLLGDLGVRIDLPEDWEMSMWSDWDFKAETSDSKVYMTAWATPTQLTPVAENISGWLPFFEEKVTELGGTSAVVKSSRVDDVKGVPVARYELNFNFEKLGMVMLGSTHEVSGKMFHMVAVTAEVRQARAEEAMEHFVGKLDVQTGPADVAWNATVDTNGISYTLPDGWRLPLENELGTAMTRAQALGIDDLEPCSVAMRAQPSGEPDVMVTCQGGMWLGVVDEYTFSATDETLRQRLFGSVPVQPAESLELSDRLAFIYDVDLPDRTLLMGVAPYDKGLARTWILGGRDNQESLKTALDGVLLSSTFSGAHPAGLGERVSYYVTYRPTSPVVLGTGAGVLGVCGGIGFMLFGRGRKSEFDDLD
jgi:hypothetical protein